MTEPVKEDNRVEIELNLDEHDIYQLAMEAHKRDITLNKMVELVLQEAIDLHKVNGTLE
jgi:predicted HicB family RNase H-like nuclease